MHTELSQKDDKNLIQAGFTLVELLIVVVILGILAGVVVFAVGGLQEGATKNACATEGETFSTAIDAHEVSNPSVALDGDDADADATVLAGEDLLKTDTLKYGPGSGADKEWSYAGGVVDTDSCTT